MKYACVKTNILDLRAKPEFSAERVNQAFFGQLVSVSQVRGNFCRIKLANGYPGWVDRRLLSSVSQANFRTYNKISTAVITKNCRLFEKPGLGQAEPHLLLYGTPVWKVSRSKNYTKIMSPDGIQYFIKSNAVVAASQLNRLKPTGNQVVREAKKFLGVPYLWGGITPLGWDCSGMVQTILARYGLIVARDTKDQIKVGELVTESNIKSGDLLFFDRHVGFAIGADRLIHSSLSGGGVRINSLRPDAVDYRKDLAETFKEARRII